MCIFSLLIEIKACHVVKMHLCFEVRGAVDRALRTTCHKFLRSGGETSLNCLKFPQIRFSFREYSAGVKTCENSRKRTRLLPKKTHSENEGEKSSPKKAKIESITKVIFRVVVRPSI